MKKEKIYRLEAIAQPPFAFATGSFGVWEIGECLKKLPKLPVSKRRKQSVLVCHLKGFATGSDGFEIGIPFTIWVNGISCHV